MHVQIRFLNVSYTQFHSWICVCVCVSLCFAGNWNQSLLYAKHMLYPWAHIPTLSSSPILFKETIIFHCFLSHSFISSFNIYSKFLFHVMFFTSNANFYRSELRKSKSSCWHLSHLCSLLWCNVMVKQDLVWLHIWGYFGGAVLFCFNFKN